jgi:hypothetical protein
MLVCVVDAGVCLCVSCTLLSRTSLARPRQRGAWPFALASACVISFVRSDDMTKKLVALANDEATFSAPYVTRASVLTC